MKTDKTTEGASTSAESVDEQPLVLKPEWMVGEPKAVEKTHTFSVTFNETTKKIDLRIISSITRSHRWFNLFKL